MINFHVEKQIWTDKIAIRMRKGKEIATSITFEELPPGQISDPIISLYSDEAQDLMDRLYAVGIRPSAAAGSAGQLDAVKYHLEDMRKLALKI